MSGHSTQITCIGSVNGDRPYNQDQAGIIGFYDRPHNLRKYGFIMMVCDGHGDPGGEVAARVALETALNELLQYKHDTVFTRPILDKIFLNMHHAVIQTYPQVITKTKQVELEEKFKKLPFTTPASPTIPPPSSSSTTSSSSSSSSVLKTGVYMAPDTKTREMQYCDYGTTASLIIWQPKLRKLTSAHVGDSEMAVMVHNKRSHTYLRTCKPHWYSNLEERKRIEKSNLLRKNFMWFHKERLRLASPDKRLHSIEPLRSIGHNLMQHFGIIPIPEIKVITLTEEQEIALIITGSDGLWDAFELMREEKMKPADFKVERKKNEWYQGFFHYLMSTYGNAVELVKDVLCHVENIKWPKRDGDNTTLAVYMAPVQHRM